MPTKKAYIAGKITGDDHYIDKFQRAAIHLRNQGFLVMSPSCLPFGFDYEDYMKICFSMIDVCDTVFFLPDWTESKGAKREYAHCLEHGKTIRYLYRVNP